MTGSDRTDGELNAAVGERDEGALRELYARHAPWISARLARRCANPEAVADVLQDTFLAAWNGAARFRGEGEVPAWLWGIDIRRDPALVPAATGAAFTVYAVLAARWWPPDLPPGGRAAWFQDEPDLAVLAMLVASGPVAALGGPLLGLLVGRWAPFRGSALLGRVVLTVGCTAAIEAAQPWRVLPPWAALVDERAENGVVVWSALTRGTGRLRGRRCRLPGAGVSVAGPVRHRTRRLVDDRTAPAAPLDGMACQEPSASVTP